MNNPNVNNNAGNKDYVDKGLDAVEKKFGGNKMQNPDKFRSVNEKITDKGRETFEKLTGKKVNSKISN